MKRKFHGGRSLLNLPGQSTTAAIVCEIEDSSDWKKDSDGSGNPIKQNGWVSPPDYAFQLANCDRSMAFELELSAEQNDLDNNLHKIDTMIEVLSKFRDGVALEQERHRDRVKTYKSTDPEIL